MPFDRLHVFLASCNVDGCSHHRRVEVGPSRRGDSSPDIRARRQLTAEGWGFVARGPGAGWFARCPNHRIGARS